MKIRNAVTLVVGLILGVLALWYAYEQFHRPSANTTNITVAQTGDFFIYLPIYIAQDKGFFRDAGLNVTIVNTGGDEKSVAAVISGSADFGVGDPTFAAIASSQGQRVEVVASVVNGIPFWGVTKNPKVPTISQPSQLNGFSVATFPDPSTAYTLQAQMFRAGGLTPNIHQAQFGTLLPLLDTGATDIVLELEPNVSTAVTQGARVVYSMAAIYGDFALTGVTVSGRTISERPDVVRRFVQALDAAERFAHAHPDEALAVAEKRFPSTDPKVAALALKRMLDANSLPDGAVISPAAWRKAIQLRVDAHQLPSVDSAMPYLDNSFVPTQH